MTKTERRNWIVALIVAFVLGFLLAWYLLRQQQHQAGCPRRADDGAPVAMNGASQGHGAPGAGSPTKLGAPGSGTAERKGGGSTTVLEGGGGAGGSGGGGDGDLQGGHPWEAHGKDQKFDGSSHGSDDKLDGGGTARGDIDGKGAGEGRQTPPQEARTARSEGPGTLYKEPGGPGGTGGTPDKAQPEAGVAAPDGVTASDFRYDKSALPRYPNGVTAVESGTALPAGAQQDPNTSISAFLTTDDPQTVAAWYQAHLPQDWKEVNLGALNMFWPPDRKADPRTVWILLDDKTHKTATLLWKAKKNAAP